jgi:beta-phosphoglucomutase
MKATTSHPEPRAVLWDLDGTLVDSAEWHFVAWREVLIQEGRDVTPEDFAHSFGKRNDLILRELMGPHVTLADVERVGKAKERLFREYVLERGVKALPGALEWLARLHADGWRQAIASSAPTENIEVIVASLGLSAFIDAMVSAEQVTLGKPAPDIFLAAARALAAPPARCIVVEDAPAGLEGARQAGMRAIGVLSESFPELRADVVVPSLAALPVRAFEELLESTPVFPPQ